MNSFLQIDNQSIKISNPEKVLWPELGIRKVDYIKALIELAPYLIPHATGRMLTVIRYPHGVEGKSFFQKKANDQTPEWVDLIQNGLDFYIDLNNRAVLIWLGNAAALEFHTSFDRVGEDHLRSLVFDLDPSEGQTFDEVVEVALLIHKDLEALGLRSLVKTSGATGMQLFIPVESRYSFEDGRIFNEFFGKYFAEKYKDKITLERMVKNRGRLLYFDYLQMWRGKTIISVYSPRAVPSAAVSTPVTWEELERGIKPSDFNLLNIGERLRQKGDLFGELINGTGQNIDFLAENVRGFMAKWQNGFLHRISELK